MGIMKLLKRIYLLAIFCCISVPSYAEETDRDICLNFIHNFGLFQDIKTQKSKCQVSEIEQSCNLFTTPQGDHLSTYYDGGTCVVTELGSVNENRSLTPLPIKNAIDHLGWGLSLIPISYKGKAFLTDKDHLYLYKIGQHDVTAMCGKVRHFEGWNNATPHNDPVCEKFGRGDFQDRSIKLDDDYSQKNRKDQAGPIKSVDAEFENGSIKERVIFWELASGAGCGCDRQFLSIDTIGIENQSADQKNLIKKLQDLTQIGCHGEKWSVITINNHDYIMRAGREPRADKRYYVRSREDNVLYDYKNKEFEEICRQSAKEDVFIDSDVQKPDALRYKPEFQSAH